MELYRLTKQDRSIVLKLSRYNNLLQTTHVIPMIAKDSKLSEEYIINLWGKFITGNCYIPNKFDSCNRQNKTNLFNKLVYDYNLWINGKTTINYIGLTGDNIANILDRLRSGAYFYARGNKLKILNYNDNEINLIYAVEKNKLLAALLKHKWSKSTLKISILDTDILNLTDENLGIFNFFDFDLTCQLNEQKINQIAQVVHSHMANKTAINIITSYGHGLTTDKYENELRPYLIRQFKNCGMNVYQHEYGSYKDSRIPMMYEHILVEKE